MVVEKEGGVVMGEAAMVAYRVQTAVEKRKERRMSVSSRYHRRRRKRRDQERARTTRVQTMCGTRMPKKMPGMLADSGVWRGRSVLTPRPVEEGVAYLGAGKVGQGRCFWGGKGERWPGDVELWMSWVHDEAIDCDFDSLHGDVMMRPSPPRECRRERGLTSAWRFWCVVIWTWAGVLFHLDGDSGMLGGGSVVTTRTVRRRKGPQEGGVVNMAA